MKTALIFGVTGQDGGYLAEFLLRRDYEVIGVARRVSVDTTARLCSVKRNPSFHLVEGDVTDPLCVYRLISYYVPEEIYNLAAQSHVGTSFAEPSHTFDVTFKGTLNCLETIWTLRTFSDLYVGALKDYPRFYQASSSEMFGSAFSTRLVPKDSFQQKQISFYDEGFTEQQYQNEDTPLRPNSPYAVAKLAAHNLVRIYREAYGIHASAGILFNHESPRRGDNFVTRKISLWVAGLYAHIREHYVQKQDMDVAVRHVLRDGDYPRIRLGNLDAQRDWGHAEDYVEAMWLMLQQPKADDYVVATGEAHTVREFLEEALRTIGVKLNAEDVVCVDENLKRPSEVPFLKGDAGKARKKLGWSPKMTFQKLVQNMVMSDIGLKLGNGSGCA